MKKERRREKADATIQNNWMGMTHISYRSVLFDTTLHAINVFQDEFQQKTRQASIQNQGLNALVIVLCLLTTSLP